MGLIENIQRECVRDLPLRDALKVAANVSVQAAVDLMREKQLGCIIVVDDRDIPLGVFTERTVIDLLLQQPGDLADLRLADHLEVDWFCVRADDPLTKVVRAIHEQGARFFCVTDSEGRAIALTGQKGLMEYIAEHFPQQVMVQRVGGRPGTQTREGA
jgi:CBS domain-containing protein